MNLTLGLSTPLNVFQWVVGDSSVLTLCLQTAPEGDTLRFVYPAFKETSEE